MRHKLRALQEAIGYRFAREHLAREALTHPSKAAESRDRPSYERLEFLGDSVLGLVISQRLFEDRKGATEKELTELRTNLVKNKTLEKVGRSIGLKQMLIVGKSVGSAKGITDSMIAQGVESIIGAVYLDQGGELKKVSSLIDQWFFQSGIFEKVKGDPDPIRLLKEWCEKNKVSQENRVTKEGPDHNCIFSVQLSVNEHSASGSGKSQMEAEWEAARDLLGQLMNERPNRSRLPF